MTNPTIRRWRMLFTAALTVAALTGVIDAAPGEAAGAAPAWKITQIAQPTVFTTGLHEKCTLFTETVCDGYTILATNIGGEATDGSTVTIDDMLPAGVTATAIQGLDWANPEGELLSGCSLLPLRCRVEQPVAPDDTIQITLQVQVTSTETTSVTNQVSVAGGGAAPVTDTHVNAVGPLAAPFSTVDTEFAGTDATGAPDLQAGSHPSELTTRFGFSTKTYTGSGQEPYKPARDAKDVVVYLPPGFVGDPQATPRCPIGSLESAHPDFEPESPTFGRYVAPCPAGSQVGVVRVAAYSTNTVGSSKMFGQVSAVYNITPEGGHPAELGFKYLDKTILLYADLVRRNGAYSLRVTVPGVPLIGLDLSEISLYGAPGVRNGVSSVTSAFITNPTRCTAQPQSVRVEANSWLEPRTWAAQDAVAYPHIAGCDLLRFDPQLTVQPETSQADAPSGYEVDLRFPPATTAPGVLQPAELKAAKVTLPVGTVISPAASDGLQACAATGPNGIDIPQGAGHADEVGEGEAIGPDGLSHLTAGHCPAASQVADVEVTTALLPAPLLGHLYVAEPLCGGAAQPACSEASATNGELFRGYIEVAGSGVIVKLQGTIAADPVTGQLTASFDNNPQFPLDELKVRLRGGARAPLANSQSCGTATATADLTPWSTPFTPDATPSSSFQVSGCAASMPFAPAFAAGTVTPTAAAFSPFTETFSRRDGEQDLLGLTNVLPPGLLARLAGVPLCSDAQASAGTCPETSRIGTVHVAAGSGSHPLWVTGRIFLTGPYKGGPFGEVVEVPAVAGPFNLGTVVVRGAIHVDPQSAQASVISDPFPQILDGVPLRTKTVNVVLDRPGFIFNPTNCGQNAVTGTVTSAQGATAAVSSPFAVTGCSKLPFKPSFSASTQGRTSKLSGASLTVKLSQRPGEANIRKVNLQLPIALPSRLTTLQKACTEAQFNANPAGCPAGSFIGTAKAVTPVLSVPLTGPAILVSHGGAAFPDVEFMLQGEGVQIVLDGKTDIKKGITYSRFETVPDAPISSFETSLPQGPHSVLAAFGNLCALTKTVITSKKVTRRVHGRLKHVTVKLKKTVAQPLVMPTTITAQNGAQVTQTTKIAVTGCSKPKPHPKAKAKRKKR